MAQDLPVDDLEELANVEVGEAFRLTRLHYGQSLADVESALRIRSCQIDAIERGDVDSLPGRVYAIGFVRGYAEYLGLDGAKAVQLFKAQYMDRQGKNTALFFHAPVSDVKVPALWLVVLSLIALSALFISWHAYKTTDRTLVEHVTKVPDDISVHVRQDILIDSVEDGDPLAVNEGVVEAPVEDMGAQDEQRSGIILNIIEQSWVEIKNAQGVVIVSDVLAKEDQYFVPNSPGLSMSLGNAANVEIIVDGRILMPLGGQGDVRRDIPLDIAYLKTLEFKDE
ncbi:MAG: helix-turn-helix domain-containing protein [Alphaproteobacteria bacterium]